MTSLRIDIDAETTTFAVDGEPRFVAPVGIAILTADVLHGDPPRPEELTNAIGLVVDHLDDLLREHPDVAGLPTVIGGPVAREIAAVELGHEPLLPLALSRSAVEDVFRTVATESARDRARNPGLDAGMVDVIVAGCCVAVAVMRRLQLDEIDVDA